MNETKTALIHPCFDEKASHTTARVHLPVAPKCNIQCKYCSRKYDCINEGRPGVSSSVLNPAQAEIYLSELIKRMPLGVVGIAGPGDAFAQPEVTIETIERCRNVKSDMLFCLSTNGLGAPEYLEQVQKAGVSHLTVTMNTLDAEIGTGIYHWARYKKRNYRGLEAAEILIERQLETMIKAKELGLSVKVNTILIPGINESQIIPVARKAAEIGCDMMNIIPLIPVEDTVFADIKEPDCKTVEGFRAKASEHISQSRHCKRCRADAVGLLGEQQKDEITDLLKAASEIEPEPEAGRDKVAFVSREGFLVNRHLGEADYLYIIENFDGVLKVTDKRKAPLPGGGDSRWLEIAAALKDCSHLLVGGAGDKPVSILSESGLSVAIIEGVAEEAAMKIFNGESIAYLKKRHVCGAGKNCIGSGNGCG